MRFLPIVERELRVAARRRGTFWMRSFLGLGTVVLWFFLLATGQRSMSRHELSMMLFVATGVVAMAFCLMTGLFLTADCLSEEKREGTLGLLFLTELKGYDVVLGKLIATSLHSFYGLLTVLPVLGLPLLMGGVTAGEFWRVTLVLISTLLFSLALGLVVSAFARESRQAMSATLLLLLILSAIGPALNALLDWLFRTRSFDVLLWPSPGYLYGRSFDFAFRYRGTRQFWPSLLTILGVATAALVVACIYLPRAWQEKSERGRRGPVGWRWRSRFGSDASRLSRRWLLDHNPFYWLATRDRLPRRLAYGMIGSLFPVWLCTFSGAMFLRAGTREFWWVMSLLAAFGLHQVLKYLVAVEASRRLLEDRQSGALELLLVTPLRIELIPTGQRQALRGVFGGVLLLVCLTNLGSLLIQLMWPHHLDPADLLLLWEVCAGGIVALALDFYTLTWVGMWMGLRAKRHNRAIFGTLARILLVPWLIMFFAWFALATNSRFGSGDAVVLFALWFIFVAVLDLALAVRARSRVFEALRNLGEPTGAAAEIPMAGCALIRTARSGTVLSAQS